MSSPPLEFNIDAKSGRARSGRLVFEKTQTVTTPVFMPVGTQATVKALRQEDLEEIGYQLILANTYHLYLRPGTELLEKFDGVKNFMSWPHRMLTDSGGFQAFSLSSLTKYKENGVEFKSHLDGSLHFFTPENVLDFQAAIGADIVMPLDDCAPYPASTERIRDSLKRTHEWLARSKDHWIQKGYNQKQSLFGISQGGTDKTMRADSARAIADLDLPGNAIGGLSVGEKNDEFLEALDAAAQHLPEEKPRYLMGVGSIPEILHAVDMGVDMFDCVLPTRNARNGQVFTSQGKLNLRGEYNKYKNTPMDESCSCRVCKRYSLGYIRHLHKTKEILAYTLSSYHNLFFMKQMMDKIQKAVQTGSFPEFKKEWLEIFSG